MNADAERAERSAFFGGGVDQFEAVAMDVVDGELVESAGKFQSGLSADSDSKAGFLVRAIGGGADQIGECELLLLELNAKLIVAALVLRILQEPAMGIACCDNTKFFWPGALGRRHQEDRVAILFFERIYAPKSSLIGLPRPSRVT